MQEIGNRLCSFNAFIGNLSSWGVGNVYAQQLLSLFIHAELERIIISNKTGIDLHYM